MNPAEKAASDLRAAADLIESYADDYDGLSKENDRLLNEVSMLRNLLPKPITVFDLIKSAETAILVAVGHVHVMTIEERKSQARASQCALSTWREKYISDLIGPEKAARIFDTPIDKF